MYLTDWIILSSADYTKKIMLFTILVTIKEEFLLGVNVDLVPILVLKAF